MQESEQHKLCKILVYKEWVDNYVPTENRIERREYLNLFRHYSDCVDDDCDFLLCKETAKALKHSSICKDIYCPICSPVKYQVLLRKSHPYYRQSVERDICRLEGKGILNIESNIESQTGSINQTPGT